MDSNLGGEKQNEMISIFCHLCVRHLTFTKNSNLMTDSDFKCKKTNISFPVGINTEVPSTVTPLAQIQATLQTTSWFEMSRDGIDLTDLFSPMMNWQKLAP